VKVAIYVRVSTSKKATSSPIGKIEDKFLQNPDVQLEPLKHWCARRGFHFTVYEDRMSGSAVKRPGFQKLMEAVRRGEVGTVVVWRFDRFARSTEELVKGLSEFRSLGVDFVSHQEAIDTSTPVGKMTFTILAAVAEMEQAMIRERVRAGIDHAREFGTKSGNPLGRPRKVFDRQKILDLERDGFSQREIASALGIGLATVCRERSRILSERRSNL
jgi:DNA invertase Pin-like site-specific DNA recombinase